MMSITYKALALIFLLVAAEANIIKSKISECLIMNISGIVNQPPRWDSFIDENKDPKWNNGLSATVNDYVDNAISMLVPVLQENGLDPMELPNIEEGFEVKIILITYSAWLKLQQGQMTGLVNVARSGNQNVNYFNKNLRVRVQLRFNDLEVMNLGPTGGIIGSLEHFDIIADVLIDFNNDEIQLQQFSITQLGRLRVRLTGNILFDWLLNPLIGVFTRLFNGVIMGVVEMNIRNVARAAIVAINTNVRNIIDFIESFSHSYNVIL